MVQEGVSLLFLGLDISPSQHYHLSVSSGFPGNLLIPVYTPAYKSKMLCPRTRHIDLARCWILTSWPGGQSVNHELKYFSLIVAVWRFFDFELLNITRFVNCSLLKVVWFWAFLRWTRWSSDVSKDLKMRLWICYSMVGWSFRKCKG